MEKGERAAIRYLEWGFGTGEKKSHFRETVGRDIKRCVGASKGVRGGEELDLFIGLAQEGQPGGSSLRPREGEG